MFARVLVPLDGSALAERALGPALEMAKKPGGRVTLLRVPVPHPVLARGLEAVGYAGEAGAHQLHTAQCGHVEDYLKTVRNAHHRDDVEVQALLAEGEVTEAILTAAADHDLIVMSTHGRSGFSRLILGSVAERVLAAAPCPVLVVRRSCPIRRILIPLDGSELSESALAPGLELALRLEAEVTLLRVADELTGYERVQLGDSSVADRVQGGLVREAETYLWSLILPPADTLAVTRSVLVGPSAGRRIVEYAEDQRADLIVMSTHGRSGLDRWVYGSVADKVVRAAHCSMLVIRPAPHRLQ